MMEKAVFFDKDGTLIYNVPYNVDPAKVVFYEDAFEALLMLKSDGYKIVIISNQPGIAYGYFQEEEIKKLEAYLVEALQTNKILLDGFYYCPHHPSGAQKAYTGECMCRKPMPGLIQRAAEDLGIDLSRSWMVGDILHDVEAGNRAGCRTILIDNGNETEWLPGEARVPGFKVKNLREAAEQILSERSLPAATEKGGANERAVEESDRRV